MHAKRRSPRALILTLLAAALALVIWPSPRALSSTSQHTAIHHISPAADAPGAFILTSNLKRADLHRVTTTVSAAPQRLYTVQGLDSLSSIAQRVYGNSAAWTVLYNANRNRISNPAVILAGWVLVVPPLPAVLPPPPAAPVVAVAATSGTPSSPPASTPAAIPVGSLQSYAQGLLNAKGWGSQFGCLNGIIMIESSWDVTAENASGAYGIPQALPGSKMAVAGSDWATNGDTQLRWMIDFYIGPDYGSPCAAWAHEQADGWY